MLSKKSTVILTSMALVLFFCVINLPFSSNAYEDNLPPQINSTIIDGNSIILSYDESLEATSVPATNDFSVKINVTEQTEAVNSVAISGSNVNIALNIAVTQSDTVLLSYVPGTNPIKDLAGNQAAALTNQQVINSTLAVDMTAPTLTSATIVGTLITVSYDESLDASSIPAESDFTVKINGTAQAGVVNSTEINGSNVNVTLNTAVSQSDTILLSYVPGTNPIKDLESNQAVALTDQPITNNTLGDNMAPTYTAINLSGSIISLVFNESLSELSIPSPDDFVIKINGIEQAGIISNVEISNAIVNMNIDRLSSRSDEVLVSYTPGSHPIKDIEGNSATGFTDITAVHIDTYIQYEFDDANQLRYVRINTGEVYEFQYDENGNLVNCLKIN